VTYDKTVRADILELFAEFDAGDEPLVQLAMYRRSQRADYDRDYEIERSKNMRCDPELRERRRESWNESRRRRWEKIRNDPVLLREYNAMRRAYWGRQRPELHERANASRRARRRIEYRKNPVLATCRVCGATWCWLYGHGKGPKKAPRYCGDACRNAYELQRSRDKKSRPPLAKTRARAKRIKP
jgi:hypothetical protein